MSKTIKDGLIQKISLPSYAKVNIGLRVLGRRKDGYHELETIFQQISLHDLISIDIDRGAKNTEISLSVDSPLLPTDDRNLAYRAALLYLQEIRTSCRIRIEIKKRIPVGAGLGGGSSNAAIVLMALNKLFDKKLEFSRLLGLARQLGADVPFFLKGGCAYATGIGDQLREIPPMLKNEHIVVVAPPIHVASGWAYAKLKIPLTNNRKNTTFLCFSEMKSHPSLWRNEFVNDFEDVVFAHFPVLREIKQKFYEMGASFVSLTGSGSAIYAVYEKQEDARNGVGSFQLSYSAFLTVPVTLGWTAIDGMVEKRKVG